MDENDNANDGNLKILDSVETNDPSEVPLASIILPILWTILPMKVYLLEVSNGLSDAISILLCNSSLASWTSPNSASWLVFKVGNICAILPDEKNAAKPTPNASPKSLNLAFGSMSFLAKSSNTG